MTREHNWGQRKYCMQKHWITDGRFEVLMTVSRQINSWDATLLFCGLIYKNVYIRLYGTEDDDFWMMNWIAYGRKNSWPNWSINLAPA